MRVFVDANVLFLAATSPAGRAVAFFRLAVKRRVSLCASDHVIEEARRNVISRSAKDVKELDRLVGQLDSIAGAPPKLVAWAGGLGLGAGDSPVLASAVASGVDGFVTGDRSNFGRLFGRVLGGVTVASIGEALQFFLEREKS